MILRNIFKPATFERNTNVAQKDSAPSSTDNPLYDETVLLNGHDPLEK